MNLNDKTLIGIAAFETLDAAARADLAQKCRGQTFAAHEQIVSQKEASDDVFFIVSGKVRATVYSESGREVIYQDLDAGEMFGELAAIDQMPRATSVVALEETLLAVMSGKTFLEMLRRYPAIAEATLRKLTHLVRQHCERIFEFSTLGVKNRIHAELLRLARKSEPRGNSVQIENAPTHAEIASRVSTHREAVTRELKELERAELIKWDRNCHLIRDIDKLAKMVDNLHDPDRV